METSFKPSHIGKKIARLRELRNLKQEALAIELGISQQAVSKLEQSETIEDEVLEKVARVLGVTAEGIKRFSEEAVFNIFGNTVTNNDNAALFNYYPNFNPIEKIVQLYDEKVALLERLLQSEKEKVEILKGGKL